MTEAFHRKYRSRTLNEYIGNEKLKITVADLLNNATRPQLILLQGYSGCGKTTMARLLAKEYNCANRDEKTGACGECDNCRAFDEYIASGEAGNVMNLHEYDCGQIKAGDITAILQEMDAITFDGSWKVFIFDEAHLMSSKTMGGILKAIEEPPENVLIILCTTNPENLLNTITSRCQWTLPVTKPKTAQLCGLLKHVCECEGVEYEAKALPMICTYGDNTPRKALTALEAVVRTKGAVTYANVTEVLQAIADTFYYEFFEFMTEERVDIFRYVRWLGGIKERFDIHQYVDGLIDFTKRGLYLYNSVQVDGADAAEIARCKKIFSAFSAMDIAHILTTLVRIQRAQDAEVEMLMLAYTGIRKPVGVAVEMELKVSDVDKDMAKEMHVANESIQKKVTMTPEDEKTLVASATTEMSQEDVISAFGAALFEGDISKLM